MVVTIYVWNMDLPAQVGHAAMKLGGGTYISWWPSEAVGKNEDKHKNTSSRGIANTQQGDVDAEGRQPDATYNLNTAFDEAAIRAWWMAFTEREEEWNLTTMNCSTVVYMALKSGCNVNHQDLKVLLEESDVWIAWTPADIKKLAEKLQNRANYTAHMLLEEALVGARERLVQSQALTHVGT